MIIKQLTDSGEILKVVNHPDIISRISVDSFTPVFGNWIVYFGCYIKNKIASLMVYHLYEDGLKCHFYCLPEYRLDYARKICRKMLKIPSKKIYVQTSDMKLKNFAAKMGFVSHKDNVMVLDNV